LRLYVEKKLINITCRSSINYKYNPRQTIIMGSTTETQAPPHPALLGSLTPPSGSKCLNFSPGPTCLPDQVMSEIQRQCFSPDRLSSMYLSHRSPEFGSIIEHAVLLMRQVMEIPPNYEVLFTHGGGHGQFAAVPLNLCPTGKEKATYILNGTWSERAAAEAKKYCSPITISSKNEDGTYTSTPNLDLTDNNDNSANEIEIDPESRYVYMCSNETVNGIELHRLPNLKSRGIDAPLVVDASSDFTTKPIAWEECNVGILYACASKNIGHPGVTVCIVRKDLLGNPSPICPGVLDYTVNSKAGNLWNTAATFNIEVVGIMMDWIVSNGGVAAMEGLSVRKSALLYDLIDSSGGFFSTPLVSDEQKAIRSRMNVPFDINGGDEEMTNKFLKEAWERGIVGLRTLTPFGVGRFLRASLYHGVSLESTEVLVDFMKEFMNENTQK